jgi:hypothetical protein
VGIEPTTKFGLLSEHPTTLFITSPESVDPFHDPRINGMQPRICTHTITADVSEIVSVDYVEYPRIDQIKKPAIITSLHGEA